MRNSPLAALIVAALVTACPPAPAPPPPDVSDAGDGFDDGGLLLDGGRITCVSVCSVLAKLGCNEGLDPQCRPVCEHARAARITGLPLACWSKAKTKVAARACGQVTCP
jgi:hypothetical protein